MTLTDFLLARIAEDEAVAREVVESDQHMQRLTDYPLDDDWSFWADTDGARPSVSVGAARVLADCEAKRRIVESWGRVERLGTNGFGPGVLRHLAAVYGDHPDYNPDWRP